VLIPFRWTELVAHVQEFVRDSITIALNARLPGSDVCVDFARMEMSRSSGKPMALSIQEFKTLEMFLVKSRPNTFT
jgi:DNA-binding response OmpR family regulator